jgi:hypothetical protein
VPDVFLSVALPAGPRERRDVDADGIAWCVREKATLGRLPALYFVSLGTFRRPTHCPDAWPDLAAAELEALSQKT